MAVIGNITVMLTILVTTRLQVSSSFYIVQLAIADLMVGIFNMGVHLGMSITDDWPFPAFVCKLFPFVQSEYIDTVCTVWMW